MGKIIISDNVSLDGVVQDPTGDEGFKLGGWFVESGGKDLEEWNKVALDDARGAEAWLLGRRSYEYFGVRWRPRTGELADRVNSMPKYVVSSTLQEPDWNNSKVLTGDVVTEVSKLKQELDGEIVVPASYQLGRTLIEHDLVDEVRLVVFPVVLGDGERLFGQTIAAELGELQANTIHAAGLYVVGHDIKAGTWHTAGDGGGSGGLCNYVVWSGVNRPGYTVRLDGPSTVDLSRAYAFGIGGPCTWVRVPS